MDQNDVKMMSKLQLPYPSDGWISDFCAGGERESGRAGEREREMEGGRGRERAGEGGRREREREERRWRRRAEAREHRFIGFNKISHENISGKEQLRGGLG